MEREEVKAIDFSSIFKLLILVPEKIECFEILYIMNFFRVEFSDEEDNILWPEVRKEVGFSRDDEWPLLLIDSSSEKIPTTECVGAWHIIEVLGSHGFIGDVSNHSAREK